MEEKDSLVHQQANNRRKLLDELEKFIVSSLRAQAWVPFRFQTVLDFPTEYERMLTDVNLSDLSSIQRSTQAAFAMQKCLNAKLSAGLRRFTALFYNARLRHGDDEGARGAEREVHAVD